MKNLYAYLAGIALLVSGVEIVGKLADAPAVSQEWIARKEDRSVQNKKERVPFARARKKSGAKAFLAPSISATNTYAITNNTGPAGASAGDELEYTVTITNGGPDPANGTTFTETIDANTTLVPGSVKASPIAQNDSYSTIGNVGINIPAGTGLFANDISPNGTAISLNSSTTVNSANGGTATITAATGAFIYEPAAGFQGNDSFTYEIQNGSGMTNTATVNITVGTNAANMIWFINAGAPAGGTGTLSKPFNNIADFQSINGDGAGLHPKDGQVIFMFSGSYTGPLTLRNDQKLLGQGSSQSILDFTGFSQPSGSNQLPNVTNSNAGRPVLTTTSGTINAINLGTTNNIKGVNVGSTTGTKISGSSVGTFTASEVGLNGSGSSLNLSNKSLNASFSEVSSTSATNLVSPIKIASSNGSLTIAGGVIAAASVPAIDIAGKTTGDRIALNVALTSVSANGGSKGLAVQYATGSFQVNGTGTTGGSGGTIQNITNRGIELRDVQNITIKNMNLTNANTAEGPVTTETDNTNANAAIHGLNVVGFTLDRIIVSGTVVQMGINLRGGSAFNLSNSTINQSGTPNIVEEGNIYAMNVGGTNSIANSSLKRPGGRAAYFSNNNVNMDRLNITNSSFEDADYASCLLFEGKGSSVMTLKIQGTNQFLRPGSSGIEVYANNTAQIQADIQGATIDIGSGADLGKGIDIAASGTSTIKFNVAGNTSDFLGGPGFNFFAFAGGYLEGNVTGNTITNNMTTEDGSFHAIAFSTQGTTARGILKINNNNILNSRSSIGISAWPASTGGAVSSVIIDNNNVQLTGENFAHGVYVNSVGGTGYNGTLCASVTNNDVTLNSGSPYAGAYRAGTAGTTLNVQQAGGSASAVWNAGANTPSGSATKSGLGTVNYGAGGPTGCPAPTFSGLREAAIEETAGRLSADSVTTPAPPVQQPVAQVTEVAEPKAEIEEAVTASPSPARTEAAQSGETVTVNGTGSGFTLPANKNTIIKFKVVIDANIPASDCQVSTQGTVSGTNFASVLTDDTNTPGTNNPTVTPVVSTPVITFCPGNQTFSPDPGTCTSTQTFTATADGCPAPTITYSVGGNPITFPYAFPAGNTTVLVTASNGIGTAPTCSFTVTVTPTPAPPITDQPDPQTACAGAPTFFSVATSQTGVTYQWQKKPFGGSFANISVGTNPTADDAVLTLSNVPVSDNLSEYRCVITNPCTSTTSDPAVLTVNQITSSSVTGTTTVNQGAPAPNITFSATGGTLPYTFTYKVNNGSNLTVSTTGVNTSVTVPQPTTTVGVFTYELVNVSDALSCSLTPPSAQTATITVANNLTATISGSTTACQNETQPVITFTAVNGIAPFTFTYKINGGADQQVTTTGANTSATVNVPTSTTGSFIYSLTNVAGAGGATTPIAGQTATVNVNEKPTIALTGAEYECQYAANPQTYTVFFTATAGAVITTDKGTVSGNTVIDIPSKETAIIVATLNGCTDTLTAYKDCAMPVTLIDFSGAKVENTIALKWNTAEETNSDHFDVQRSADGRNWATIAVQKSQGESYQVVNYGYVDKKPGAGVNYYRLKMVDTDKTFAYSKIIKVDFDNPALLSEFYPNPVSDVLNLKSSDWNQVKSVEIHSLTGLSVYKSGKAASKTIDVKNLPVGMYILTITHKNGEVINRKVLINR
ncbi:Por secretion system C-terminal sorting domain-containing protein [Dyadobacter soli]|uniref:Por secretion system C-terminal sorting domain-containing protein n=1 Tax=Dyadobacter soli TaxID=659014 RepID=A0A1G7LQS5_9BACT|nr:T9SS type A sorting domain-containing protein [Dyadobacter soli]SDF51350.1 Por secretion system C-terminal sorting domain-containing protein [Dyadobacter soli]